MSFDLIGGAKRDRTADLLHAMQALSQLSYSPNDGHFKLNKKNLSNYFQLLKAK
jgi:hypothetical protein